MTDPVTTPTAAPANGQKSPLDVLEDILNDAKGGAQAAQAEQAADQAVQAEEQQKVELVQLQEQKKLEDGQKIQEQLLAMQQVKQSPEQQERERQDKQQDDTQKQQLNAEEGYEVVQLDHIKI